ncbi:MAG: M48 family metallopeptidase [Phycisphaerae bacterium]
MRGLSARHAVAIIAALLCAGCESAPPGDAAETPPLQAGDPGAARIADALEECLGGPVDDPRLQQYVSDIGRRLADRRDRRLPPCRFVLVRSRSINAFATGSGRILLCAGMLASLQNERQLAAVLAHEIGHVQAGHASGSMRGMAPAAPIEPNSRRKAPLPRVYSLQQETTADATGATLLARAGFDPRGLVEVLEHLRLLDRAGAPEVLVRARTHPISAERIARAKLLVATLLPVTLADSPQRSRVRFLAMQRRALAVIDSSADRLTETVSLRE